MSILKAIQHNFLYNPHCLPSLLLELEAVGIPPESITSPRKIQSLIREEKHQHKKTKETRENIREQFLLDQAQIHSRKQITRLST